jgi:hypothetical protein
LRIRRLSGGDSKGEIVPKIENPGFSVRVLLPGQDSNLDYLDPESEAKRQTISFSPIRDRKIADKYKNM